RHLGVADMAVPQTLRYCRLELFGCPASNADLTCDREGDAAVSINLNLAAQLRKAKYLYRNPVERPYEMDTLAPRQILQSGLRQGFRGGGAHPDCVDHPRSR